MALRRLTSTTRVEIMRRMRHQIPGGALEYDVLSVVWELESATGRQVFARLGERAGLAYTTIATVLDRLHTKGLLSRVRVGRSFVYRPRVVRARVERARAIDVLRRLLGADARPAIAGLVDAVATLDPTLLDELARAVEARRKGHHGS